jgi:hypothetical protein
MRQSNESQYYARQIDAELAEFARRLGDVRPPPGLAADVTATLVRHARRPNFGMRAVSSALAAVAASIGLLFVALRPHGSTTASEAVDVAVAEWLSAAAESGQQMARVCHPLWGDEGDEETDADAMFESIDESFEELGAGI